MIHTIIVSGYEKDELTFKAACALKQAESVLLHTEKCGFSEWLKEENIPYTSFDDLYEKALSFDEHMRMVLEEMEEREGVFCVLTASDRAAREYLITHPRTQVIGAGESALEMRAINRMLKTSASDIANISLQPLSSCIVTEIDTRLLAGEVKLMLQSVYGDEAEAFVRMPEGQIISIALSALDRLKQYDHRTACLVNPPVNAASYDLESLMMLAETKKPVAPKEDPDELASALCDVVQSVCAAERHGLYTMEEVCESAAKLLNEKE